MSCFVDDMAAAYGRMTMFHLIADSREELDAMVDKIGVRRKWIQYAGTYKEHYDICKAKRELAIQHGAVAITVRELGMKLTARREAQ